MGCTVFKPRPMTYREVARLWQSNGDEYPFTRSDDAFLDTVIPSGAGPVFVCGGDVAPTCQCGHLSDVLCDWPVGDGKTCDIPLCPDCAHHVGDDRDLCPLHFAMFAKYASPAFIFPKGPRLVR